MKEDVAELVKLYDEDSQASSKFGKLQDAIVPYRTPHALSMPQMVKSGPLVCPRLHILRQYQNTKKLLKYYNQPNDTWTVG